MSASRFTLLIVVTTFLMGSSFAVVKIGLIYSSPLLLAALRFILAGGIMGIICCKRENREKPVLFCF